MAYEYPIGTRIMYKGHVTYSDYSCTWTANCEKCGTIMAIHPENKKRYEVLPDGYSIDDDSARYHTERVHPKAVIGPFSGWGE
jgi:hypothetical protein